MVERGDGFRKVPESDEGCRRVRGRCGDRSAVHQRSNRVGVISDNPPVDPLSDRMAELFFWMASMAHAGGSCGNELFEVGLDLYCRGGKPVFSWWEPPMVPLGMVPCCE